jgi:hypothetical protein
LRPAYLKGALLLVPFAALLALALAGVEPEHAHAYEKKLAGDVVVREWQVEPEVRTAGGNVRVLGEVEGDVSSGFGAIEIHGPVGGDVEAGSGDVFVDAPVGGDVHLGTGYLRLGPNAEVAGRVSVGSGRFWAHPQAEYGGEVRAADMSPDFERDGPMGAFTGLAGRTLAALLLAASAVLLAVLAPRPLRTVAASLEATPGRALLLGLGSLPATVGLCVALALTGVGLLLLPLLVPAYLFLVLFGALVAAYALGRAVLLATGKYRAGDAVAAAVGALLVVLVSLVPFVGGLLVVLLALAGAGATVMALLAHKQRSRPLVAQRSL